MFGRLVNLMFIILEIFGNKLVYLVLVYVHLVLWEKGDTNFM